MKKALTILFVATAIALYSCGSGGKKTENKVENESVNEVQESDLMTEDISEKGNVAYVELNDPLEVDLVEKGKIIFNNRCNACHYLTEEKLVGPGWAGITNRREPQWIMNMILNVNVMKEVDSLAHAVSTENISEMPDQYLSVDRARAVLEFMRQNDLDQVGTKDQGAKEENTDVEG